MDDSIDIYFKTPWRATQNDLVGRIQPAGLEFDTWTRCSPCRGPSVGSRCPVCPRLRPQMPLSSGCEHSVPVRPQSAGKPQDTHFGLLIPTKKHEELMLGEKKITSLCAYVSLNFSSLSKPPEISVFSPEKSLTQKHRLITAVVIC